VDENEQPRPPDAGEADETGEADEADEAKDAQDEADVDRFRRALTALDSEAIGRGLATMSDSSRRDVAEQLNLPPATSHLGDALVPLVRRKLRAAALQRQVSVAFALTEGANGETIAALGPRSDDPSRDDLLEVLPAVLEANGAPMVTLMLASYGVSDAPCRGVMRDLLVADERFAIPEVADDEPATDFSFGTVAPHRADDDPEVAAKREQRRAAKAAKREASEKKRQAHSSGEAARRKAQHHAKKQRHPDT
jgi:hypothetical protein